MVNRLMRHPFLAGMNRRQLGLLAGWAKIAQFKKGQVIFHEGDLADRFYLIETGNVRLESSSGSRDPRSGYSWMFPPHIRTFTARAGEPVTAIFFYGPILREYCEKDHSFGYEFLKRMSLEMYRRQTARNKIPTLQPQSGLLQAPGAVAA
jgi:cAMP-binding proteins - catabolite gene activator and regulatory subunit of cAMP-dependent protein kinases